MITDQKEEIKFKLVGRPNPVISVIGTVGLLGFAVFLLGLLLNKLGNAYGSFLCMIGFVSFFPTIFFMVLNSGGRFIKERKTTDGTLRISGEEIEVNSRIIKYEQLKSISLGGLEFKGEPNIHNRFRPINSGADNKITMMFQNYKEEKVRFFIERKEDMEKVLKLFDRVKKNKGIMIIK